MKLRTGSAAVGAAVILLAMSGWSYASEADPERSLGRLPSFEDRDSPVPLETGSLSSHKEATATEGASVSTDQAPTVEIGGVVYRIGIDTR